MPAYYRASLAEFLMHSDAEILGTLAAAQGVEGHAMAFTSQTNAWREQMEALRLACEWVITRQPSSKSWSLLLEYPIPRRQKRIDTVILSAQRIYCLEFKTGAQKLPKSSLSQVEDYALDLRDFHAASLGREIIPAVVCRQFEAGGNRSAVPADTAPDIVTPPWFVIMTALVRLSSITKH